MDLLKFDNPNGEFKPIERGVFKGKLSFIPKELPTSLEEMYDNKLCTLLSRADLKLGELNGCGKNDPNVALLVAPYRHLEAVYSSQIEGTQTTLSDFYLVDAERNGTMDQNYFDVRNYIDAMTLGFERIDAGDKISLQLVSSLHKKLLRGCRDVQGVPGEIREDQNWIAPLGVPNIDLATYVPPRIEDLNRLITNWESFVQTDHELPPLLQTALMHYQFEAIHPFSDGNGRIGRLLLSLYLAQQKCLVNPILFLSFYFRKNRDEYYGRLLNISQRSDWDGWFKFFLTGVINQADTSIQLSKNINELRSEYENRVKRKTSPVRNLVDLLFDDNPIVYTANVAKKLGITQITAKRAILTLEKEGILDKGETKKPIYYYSRGLLDLLENP